MRVAEAAIAARRDQRALPRMHEVGQKRLVVFREDLRSGRHLQHGILARRARSVRAHAMLAITGCMMLLIAEIDQRIVVLDAFGPDATAPAAIAAVGSAEFDKLLTPEREAAIAAVSRPNVNFCLIQEAHKPQLRRVALRSKQIF